MVHLCVHLHGVIKRKSLGPKYSHLTIMQNLATVAVCTSMMIVFIEYEEIEVQRGNFWPNLTRKVGERVSAGAEGFLCPLTFRGIFEVPSFG